MKYVIPVMIKNKGGSIINISSIAGLRAEVPEVGPASYGASKAAIINLTQVAAMEYVKDGIRVNCIAPGMHKSDLGVPRNMPVDPEFKKRMEKMIAEYCAAEIPMGRQAEASEIKGLAVCWHPMPPVILPDRYLFRMADNLPGCNLLTGIMVDLQHCSNAGKI